MIDSSAEGGIPSGVSSQLGPETSAEVSTGSSVTGSITLSTCSSAVSTLLGLETWNTLSDNSVVSTVFSTGLGGQNTFCCCKFIVLVNAGRKDEGDKSACNSADKACLFLEG